jgi:hypothetical protein
MKTLRAELKTFDFGIHEKALLFHGPTIDATKTPFVDRQELQRFLRRHPPTFARLDDANWLVANHLSLILLVRHLQRTKFLAKQCDLRECHTDRDVARFAVQDRTLYDAVLQRRTATPRKRSRVVRAEADRLASGQVCPICPSLYKSRPLAAPPDALGRCRRGQGGVLRCKKKGCGFQLQVSAPELNAFVRKELPTRRLLRPERRRGRAQTCPLCARNGRRGVLFRREYPFNDGEARVLCSNELRHPRQCNYSVADYD